MGKVKKGSYIYIAYDRGDGLPIAVADSVAELSEMIREPSRNVRQAIYKKSPYYAKVVNDEYFREV